MTLFKVSASVAALALVAAPAMASAATAPSANPAASLSVSQNARVGTPAKSKSRLSGNGAIIVGVLALAAVAGGIIAVTQSDDSPDSR